MKKTLDQKLHERKIKKPNYIIYNFLGHLWKYTVAKKYKMNVNFIDDPKKEKGAYILISNHASRLDYIFTAVPLLPQTLNFVAGYNEFLRSHLHTIFHLLQEIPKKNFTPDMYTVLEIFRVIKSGGRVVLFPEGMSSISGGSQPVALGSGKLLKKLNVPVYVSSIKGGYLVSPKYNLIERPGKVEVSYKKLFSVDDLSRLNADEIQDILNKEIQTNDYLYNETAKNIYKTNEVMKNIEQLLYKCPVCGAEFENESGNNYLVCKKCHNKVEMDNSYALSAVNGKLLFKNPKDWFDYQREEVKKEIQDPEFYLEDEVDIGFLPKYEYLKNLKTSEIEGNGVLRIDHKGIHFQGIRNNEPYEVEFNLVETPTYGMCTDASRFYTFYKGEFIEFYPKRLSTIKWLLVTEELHRLHNGKWKNYND